MTANPYKMHTLVWITLYTHTQAQYTSTQKSPSKGSWQSA